MFNELTLLRDAREESWEKGREDGREEGQTLARIATLTRLMTRHFGPLPDWVLAELQQATSGQIDAWLDRILDAPTVQGVFDDR